MLAVQLDCRSTHWAVHARYDGGIRDVRAQAVRCLILTCTYFQTAVAWMTSCVEMIFKKIMALHNIAGVLMAGVYWRNASYEAVLRETISSMRRLQFEIIHENQRDSSAKRQQQQQKKTYWLFITKDNMTFSFRCWCDFLSPRPLS